MDYVIGVLLGVVLLFGIYELRFIVRLQSLKRKKNDLLSQVLSIGPEAKLNEISNLITQIEERVDELEQVHHLTFKSVK